MRVRTADLLTVSFEQRRHSLDLLNSKSRLQYLSLTLVLITKHDEQSITNKHVQEWPVVPLADEYCVALGVDETEGFGVRYQEIFILKHCQFSVSSGTVYAYSENSVEFDSSTELLLPSEMCYSDLVEVEVGHISKEPVAFFRSRYTRDWRNIESFVENSREQKNYDCKEETYDGLKTKP
jgi:hypothetical protein